MKRIEKDTRLKIIISADESFEGTYAHCAVFRRVGMLVSDLISKPITARVWRQCRGIRK